MRRPRASVLPLFIPFAGCPHRCVYCDQRSLTGAQARLDRDWAGEIAAMLGAPEPATPPEVAFYGGSFTSLPPASQDSLLEAVRPFIADGRVSGVRVSARPDAVDPAALERLEAGRVVTVELGAQSMDDEVLRLAGRGHDAAATRRAARLVRGAGLRLGLQMMTGLPGDTLARALKTALQLADLEPDLVRIYPTVVLEGTPLAGLWRRGAYRPWGLEETVEALALLVPLFRSRLVPLARLGLLLGDVPRERVLAGPAHPSLGSLVQARVAARRLRECRGEGAALIRVNPAERSAFPSSRTRRGSPGVLADPRVPAGWLAAGGQHFS